jgi:hypothetical protein
MPFNLYHTTRRALFSASRAALQQKMQEKTHSHQLIRNRGAPDCGRVGRQGSQTWARMGFICFWMDSGMSFPVPEKFLPRRLRLSSVFFDSFTSPSLSLARSRGHGSSLFDYCSLSLHTHEYHDQLAHETYITLSNKWHMGVIYVQPGPSSKKWVELCWMIQ